MIGSLAKASVSVLMTRSASADVARFGVAARRRRSKLASSPILKALRKPNGDAAPGLDHVREQAIARRLFGAMRDGSVAMLDLVGAEFFDCRLQRRIALPVLRQS